MMTLSIVLLLAAAACVSAQSAQKPPYYFELKIQADNTAKEIKAQTSDIKKEIINEVCKGAKLVDGPIGEIVDKSGRLDSQSTSTWYCYANTRSAAEGFQKRCFQGSTYRKLKDELEDSTSAAGGGEIELEKLTCLNVMPTPMGRRLL